MFNWKEEAFIGFVMVLTLAPEEHVELLGRVFSQLQRQVLVPVDLIVVAGMAVEDVVQHFVLGDTSRYEGPVLPAEVTLSKEDTAF